MSKWANYYTKKVLRSDIVQHLGQLVTRATFTPQKKYPYTKQFKKTVNFQKLLGGI